MHKSVIYKVKCHNCPFTYIGESKCSWSLCGAEHDPCNNDSAINQHVETLVDRNIHPKDAEILKCRVKVITEGFPLSYGTLLSMST